MIDPSLKNIAALPAKISPLIAEFSGKILVNLDDNAVALLVYGSAVNGNFNPGVSNINLAVVVRNMDFNILKENLDIIRWGHKRKIATPLFLTKEYILNSLDVFPIEFMEIKERHCLIWGEDIFKDLDIPRKDVRLLCEQQVKGKMLHLRQAYLEIGPDPSALKKILLAVFNDLLPVFRQLIVLKNQKPAEGKEGMLKQLAELFSLDGTPLLVFHEDKAGKTSISSHQVDALFENFLNQLKMLSRHLDTL